MPGPQRRSTSHIQGPVALYPSREIHRFPVALAGLLARDLGHMCAQDVLDEEWARMPSIRALQTRFRAAGVDFEDSTPAGFPLGITEWDEERDEEGNLVALLHVTGTGRTRVRVTDESLTLSSEAGPLGDSAEGRLVCEVVISQTRLGWQIEVAHLDLDLLAGREDRLEGLWALDDAARRHMKFWLLDLDYGRGLSPDHRYVQVLLAQARWKLTQAEHRLNWVKEMLGCE